jgi:hypothetical protein
MGAIAKQTDEVFGRMGIETKPTFAQKTGGHRAARFEQSESAKNAEIAAILKGQDEKILKEAQKSIEKEFAGKGTIRDTVKAVEKQTAELTTRATKAESRVAGDIARIKTGRGVQRGGEKITNTLEGERMAERGRISNLYDQIPQDITLDAGIIKTTLKKTVADIKKIGGGQRSVPSDIIRQLKGHLKKTKGQSLTFDQLRDLRSQIGEEIRESLMGANPNLKLTRRLQMLKHGIDDSLDQMLNLGGVHAEASALYRQASKEYAQYIQRFKSGEVGNVLQAGSQASGKKVAYSGVPQRFFVGGKMDAADDLIRAVGKTKATTLIDDFAGLDLISKAEVNGVLKTETAKRWLKTNKDVLNKYGLYGKYSDVVKNQIISDSSATRLVDYSKTVASRIIGTDVEKIIPNIFSGAGKKQSGLMAQQLLNLPGIKGNPAAIGGIRRAFKDHYLKEIHSVTDPIGSVSKAKKIITELKPALRVLYKDKPKQLQKLYDYHSVLEVLQRTKNVTRAGGSTTIEKVTGLSEGGSLVGSVAQYIAVTKGAGWKFSVLKNMWKAFFGAPRRYSERQINRLLSEALVDPQVAETIMMASRYKAPKEVVSRRIKHHLVVLGMYKVDKEK